MPSIYDLKPRFQALLRPLVVRLHAAGVTANQVTLLACAVSLAVGAALCLAPERRPLFALIPLWMLLRMGLNAIDGMLAREFGQKSSLGAYLNELTDVFSDAALYLPFAFLPHFAPLWVCAAIGLAMASEYAGVLGLMVGATRRYDGPLGKSDRAFVFGLLGLCIALGMAPAPWQDWIMPALCVLLALTLINRVRAGLAESRLGGG
ncbi:MAG: CDP-alcohol phosphatidyltransferase family protein [Sterolibacteriaceae bacterium]|nr:CDP-alcohol phosphatidyltransferase family protein [Candidatus Methylophosphatis haderslevensis]